MSMEYMHVGIPITNKKENMTYVEGMKLWMSTPDDYPQKIEYLKFEEGTIFPEILHRMPHVAYKVDDLDKYVGQADWVIVQPMSLGENVRIAFVMVDNTIFEYYEDKN